MTSVTSRVALAGNDFVDWSLLPPSVVIGSPFGISSNVDQFMIVTDGTDFKRFTEGFTWFGNFARGDQLLWNSHGGPTTIDFNSAVSGGGAQFQAPPGPFTATIEAFNGSTLLGMFSAAGLSNDNGDNSAVFLGVEDLSGANITRLVFDVDTEASSRDFAINRVDVLTTERTPIPEPSSCVLLFGVLGVTAWAIRLKLPENNGGGITPVRSAR